MNTTNMMETGAPALRQPLSRMAGACAKHKTVLLENQMHKLLCSAPRSWNTKKEQNSRILETGDLLVDPFARIVYRNGEMVRLGPVEYDLLEHMISHSTLFCSRKILLSLVEKRYNRRVADNTLSKHINRLRKKLGQSVLTPYVLTRNCSGYKWGMPVEKLYIERELM